MITLGKMYYFIKLGIKLLQYILETAQHTLEYN